MTPSPEATGPWKAVKGQERRLHTEWWWARRDPPKCEYGPQSEDGARNQCAQLNAAESIRDAAPELLTASERILDYLECSGQGDIPSAKKLRSAIKQARGAQ